MENELRQENIYEQKVALRSWMHWVKATSYFVSSEKRWGWYSTPHHLLSKLDMLRLSVPNAMEQANATMFSFLPPPWVRGLE